MNITDYIQEVDHAVKQLLSGIWSEREKLDDLERKYSNLSKAVKANYDRASSLALNAEDPEEVAMAVGVHWDNYFGEDKERHNTKTEIDSIKEQISAHQFSIESLSGALLQHAKQGISLQHNGLQNCSDGRLIGTQPLKDVIWQGRNQAIHWEEGNFNQKVIDCFQKLEQDIDIKFAGYTTKCMAFDVVELLGWNNKSDFDRDMQSLV